MQQLRRDAPFLAVVVLTALMVVYGFVPRPYYTDAYYYINAANRLVSGQGLTDAYLWTYINMPDSLPTPSHMYWMPMASLLGAVGMWLMRAPGAYWAAQVPFVLMLVGLAYLAYDLGRTTGGLRHAWAAGLMMVWGGFFSRYWGAVETFTPYGLFGALCLLSLGRGLTVNRWLWFLGAGAFAALGHLTRADGVLLMVAGFVVIFWPWLPGWGRGRRLRSFSVLLTAYLLVIAPWFVRNVQVMGTALPVGGAQGIWYTEYNDLFNYPPDASPETFFADGWGVLWASRWTGFTNGLGTLLAVEGMIVLAPFMLLGLFRRLREPFWWPFAIYALGLHLAMMLVFPYPGFRGGLFHSAAALMPFWVVLGVLGLDDAVGWVAARRRRWRPAQAKAVFTTGLVLVVIALSVSLGWGGRPGRNPPGLYANLAAVLPVDARVMINDPAQMYYFTGLGGVVIPNEGPEVIPEIAMQYGITHLILEGVNADGLALAAPAGILAIPQALPPFLNEVPFDTPSVRVYRIELAE